VTTSAMASEIGESAEVLSPELFVTAPPRATSHGELGLAPPPVYRVRPGKLWACRGFLKIETRLRLPVSASAPSVITAFRTPLMLRHSLFIVISQSGRSPDLVAATRSARAAGARTVAIVNARSWPVADEAEFVVPIEAGPEHSLAATKTVIGSMAASAALVAELAGDRALRSALDRLPECLHRALALDWSEIVDDLAKA
jgi:glutamine---fructose-6-phosphate transaminase (isomerizing)